MGNHRYGVHIGVGGWMDARTVAENWFGELRELAQNATLEAV
jgi:hypothetical protein